MKRGLKYDFTLKALVLVPVGVSLGVVGKQLSSVLSLPIFLDQAGTMLVAMIAGPWVGMVTGLLCNIVNGLLAPTSFPFAIVSMLLGIVTGYLSRWKFFTNIPGIVLGWAVQTLMVATSSSIVSVFVFGGVTGAGTDLLTAAFAAMGQNLWKTVLSAQLTSEVFAAAINFFIAWGIIRRMPDRFLVKMNYGQPYIKKKGAVINE